MFSKAGFTIKKINLENVYNTPIVVHSTMNTTSKKQATFLSTPLSSIVSLNQVPGVGAVTLEKLVKMGFSTPAKLLGQFMVLEKDPRAMNNWLESDCGIRAREAGMISEALLAKMERMEML